jgi:Flp pilus assembly protein TadD
MDKMLEDYPDNPELHNQRAAMAYAQDDMDKALQHFEKAAKLAPQNAAIQRQVGDFYYVVQKDADKALVQYEKTLAMVPNDVETLMLAGHVSISLHQYPQARQYYQQVRNIDPNNGDALQFLDKLSEHAEDPQASEVSVDELYASAQAKGQVNEEKEAIALLMQLVEKEPQHALAHNDLGVLFYKAGDTENARIHYEHACRLAPENEVFQKNLADFYWVVLVDPHLAMRQYVQVLKLDPQDVEVLLSCVQICLALKKTDDAREFLDTALAIEPWNEDVKQMQRQLDEGIDTLSSAMNGDLHNRAKTRAAFGDLKGAIDDLEQILLQLPGQSKYHNELGVLYYEVGEKEKALAHYEQAVQLEPSEPNYAKNLADFYLMEEGRVEEAMKLYLKVLEKNPDDVEALMATGLVCVSIEKIEDAKHFYNRVLEIEPWNQTATEALADIEKRVVQGENKTGSQAAVG